MPRPFSQEGLRMVYTDPTEIGQAPSSPLPSSLSSVLDTHRGWTNYGLRKRVIGRYTFQVTGGTADAANTYDITVNGVSLCGTAVVCTAVVNTDAASIATAINARTATTGWYATVSAATVTIRQRKSGAVTVAKVVTGDATATLATGVASTDTWTEHLSGVSMDGDEYYEFSWLGSLVADAAQGTDLTNARIISIRFKLTGQAFQLWSGEGVITSSNAILAGDPTAADTWTEDLPWVDGAIPLTFKGAADAVLSFHAKFI